MSSCLPLLVMHDCRSTPWHLTGGLPSRKRWRTATRHWWRCCYPMAPSSIRWALLLSSRAASLSLSLSLSSLSLLARCCSTHFLCSLWYSTHALFLLSLFALLLQHALPLLALLLHARTLSVRSAAAALTLSARSAAARTHSLCSLCCCTHSLPAPTVAAPSARSTALSLSVSLAFFSLCPYAPTMTRMHSGQHPQHRR